MKLLNLPPFVNVQPKEKKFGQQTPRRWGWGTPLKKRAATRTKSSISLELWRELSMLKKNGKMTPAVGDSLTPAKPKTEKLKR